MSVSLSPVGVRSLLAPAPQLTEAKPVAARARPLDSFEGAPRLAAPTAGSWRAPADSALGKTIAAMLERVRQCPIRLHGESAEEVLSKAILDNPRITNAQLEQIAQVPLEKLADSPEDRAKCLEKIPDARERDSHKFTVAMLAAATGVDPKALSEAAPTLGMTGAIGTPLFYAPRSERMKRSTALHDFTDYLRGAGVAGVNKAVWGVENRVLSAAMSVLKRWRY